MNIKKPAIILGNTVDLNEVMEMIGSEDLSQYIAENFQIEVVEIAKGIYVIIIMGCDDSFYCTALAKGNIIYSNGGIDVLRSIFVRMSIPYRCESRLRVPDEILRAWQEKEKMI